jgi:hypothetical protein
MHTLDCGSLIRYATPRRCHAQVKVVAGFSEWQPRSIRQVASVIRALSCHRAMLNPCGSRLVHQTNQGAHEVTDPNIPRYAPPPPVPAVWEQPPAPVTRQAVYRPQMTPIRKQGAWSLWWLVGVTFGIYYYVWYARINRELAAVLGIQVPADGEWWSQLIPFYNFVGLARTAKRVNAAHAAVGSPTRVGVFVTWFWAAGWFASQTRYLQRRINILHDVMAAMSAR